MKEYFEVIDNPKCYTLRRNTFVQITEPLQTRIYPWWPHFYNVVSVTEEVETCNTVICSSTSFPRELSNFALWSQLLTFSSIFRRRRLYCIQQEIISYVFTLSVFGTFVKYVHNRNENYYHQRAACVYVYLIYFIECYVCHFFYYTLTWR